MKYIDGEQIVVAKKNTTLKAIAVKPGMTTSEMMTEVYTITNGGSDDPNSGCGGCSVGTGGWMLGLLGALAAYRRRTRR
jgi:MYXO-CTERM domain-containing protein